MAGRKGKRRAAVVQTTPIQTRISTRATTLVQQTPSDTPEENDSTVAQVSQPETRGNANQAAVMQRFDYGGHTQTQTTQPIVRKTTGKLCESFSGSDGLIRIEDWLIVFEITTEDWTDKERISAVCRHLTGEATRWLVREVAPSLKTMSWDQFKELAHTRFGRPTRNPLEEAFERLQRPGETMESYFNEKRRLLQLAGESDANQVALLSRGLQDSLMRNLIRAQCPETPAQWLKIALNLDEPNMKTVKTRAHDGEAHQVTENGRNEKKKTWDRNKPRVQLDFSKPPTTPCPVCKAFRENKLHWRKDCPKLKAQASTTQSNDAPSASASTHAMHQTSFVTLDILLNGHQLRPFVDSGSTITAISKKTADRLKLRWNSKSSIPLTHIAGSTATLGSVDVNIEISGQTFRTTVHVLKDLAHEMLIGLDIARRANLTIQFTNTAITSTICSAPAVAHVTHVTPQNPIDQLMNRTDVFTNNETDLGRVRECQHKIRLTPDAVPVNKRPFRMSAQREKDVQKHVDSLLATGVIRKSHSAWASPFLLVPKADGTLRPLIDFRGLNKVTIPERHPLPRIQNLIDQLKGSAVFSKLDVAWSFWQIPLHPDSIELTAFVVPNGHFEWLTLPMGLRNSSSVFQREMRRILGDMLKEGIVQFVDDILIHTETVEQHVSLLNRVLDRLSQEGVKLRREKCSFLQTEVTFLGQVVSKGQVKPSENKTKAVKEFPTPKSPKDVKSFVGLANFFRNFVENFSSIASPLTHLTKSNVAFHWDTLHQQAFDTLKRKLTESPVLTIFDPSLPIVLTTDASGSGLGAVLTQKRENGEQPVIAFWSSKLNQNEARYSAPEWECLAVVKAIEHFRPYLDGVTFEVISDCSSLQWLFNIKNPNSRLFRWSIRLSCFDFKITHRPGKTNKVADALSRHAVLHIKPHDFLHKQYEIATYGLRKPLLVNGLTLIRCRGRDKLVVPPSEVANIIREFHDNMGHQGIEKTTKAIRACHWFPDLDQQIAAHIKSCQACQISKQPNTSLERPFHPIPTPEKPREIWAADCIVMGSAANQTSAKFIITIVDLHSRHVWAKSVKRITAEATISVLKNIFESVGAPKALLTDNGTNFVSKRFKNFLASDENHVKHLLTPPHRSQANGLCERTNKSIIAGLRVAVVDRPTSKWSSLLASVVKNLNRQVHDVTGFSAEFLQFGITSDDVAIVPVEEARQQACKSSRDQQNITQQKQLLTTKPSNFEIGDAVRHRLPHNHPELGNKLNPKWWAPCIVTEKMGHETFRLQQIDLNDNSIIRTFTSHASLIAPYVWRTETDESTPDLTTVNQSNAFHLASHESPMKHSENDSLTTQETNVCITTHTQDESNTSISSNDDQKSE